MLFGKIFRWYSVLYGFLFQWFHFISFSEAENVDACIFIDILFVEINVSLWWLWKRQRNGFAIIFRTLYYQFCVRLWHAFNMLAPTRTLCAVINEFVVYIFITYKWMLTHGRLQLDKRKLFYSCWSPLQSKQSRINQCSTWVTSCFHPMHSQIPRLIPPH